MISKRSGFTLLEILIVIGILGIILTAAVPRVGSFREEYKLYSLARKCVLDLKYAQQLSIDTKDEYGVYFTTTGYDIKFNSNIISTTALEGAQYMSIQGIFENKIVFKSTGEPCQSGKITFKSNYSNREIYVNVTPETGEVSENWN